MDSAYTHPFAAHIGTKTCGFVPSQRVSAQNNLLVQVPELWNTRQRWVISGEIAWLCGDSYNTNIRVHSTDSGPRANCADDHPIGYRRLSASRSIRLHRRTSFHWHLDLSIELPRLYRYPDPSIGLGAFPRSVNPLTLPRTRSRRQPPPRSSSCPLPSPPTNITP